MIDLTLVWKSGSLDIGNGCLVCGWLEVVVWVVEIEILGNNAGNFTLKWTFCGQFAVSKSRIFLVCCEITFTEDHIISRGDLLFEEAKYSRTLSGEKSLSWSNLPAPIKTLEHSFSYRPDSVAVYGIPTVHIIHITISSSHSPAIFFWWDWIEFNY